MLVLSRVAIYTTKVFGTTEPGVQSRGERSHHWRRWLCWQCFDATIARCRLRRRGLRLDVLWFGLFSD